MKPMSRRSFLERSGTGMAAAAAIPALEAPILQPQPLQAEERDREIHLKVNGKDHRVKVEDHWTLVEVLRDHLGLTGTREAWTHAVLSVAAVLEIDQGVCRMARIVLGAVAPIPWQLPHVERMLVGQRITTELAGNAGQAAVSQAQPLAKNGYKIPLTEALVRRTLLSLAG